MGERIEFERPDGQHAPAYFAHAAGEGGGDVPGIVLFQEWWGIDAHIEDVANRLAAQGFDVLVPDLYRGRVAATGDEAHHLMEGLDFNDAVQQDARGAAAFLRARGARKVGVTGFCMGGVLAFLCAIHLRDQFDASVVFYGYPPPQAGDPASITMPLMAHWALHDEHFDISGVDAIEAKLKHAGVPYEFHRYDAKHAFLNPGGLGNYDEHHAKTAWDRTVAFFEKNLR